MVQSIELQDKHSTQHCIQHNTVVNMHTHSERGEHQSHAVQTLYQLAIRYRVCACACACVFYAYSKLFMYLCVYSVYWYTHYIW